MENVFKKGLILGGLLAGMAAIGLAMTKEGQVLSAELQKDLKPLANNLKKNLHKLTDVTKDDFNNLVSALVDEYAKKNKTADDAKKLLVSTLQKKWHEMEAELNEKS